MGGEYGECARGGEVKGNLVKQQGPQEKDYACLLFTLSAAEGHGGWLSSCLAVWGHEAG